MADTTETRNFWEASRTVRSDKPGTDNWLRAFTAITGIAAASGSSAVQERARELLYQRFHIIVTPASDNDDREPIAAGGSR